jgi:L-alanine-DL-glutamate epimerase-like enolase superfamily enzyme
MLKILALASTYDLPVIPHGHSTPASAHVIASQRRICVHFAGYLIKWNDSPVLLEVAAPAERRRGHAAKRPGSVWISIATRSNDQLLSWS